MANSVDPDERIRYLRAVSSEPALFAKIHILFCKDKRVNPCPAEPRYTLPLQMVLIQISWLLKKPSDLDLQFAIKYVNL